MTKDKTDLKDFYYLNVDKVRSFVAQLREGLPDAFEKTRLQRGQGGLNVGLHADYAYERTETETSSLHHYLYTILESTLREAGKLLDVDSSFGGWRQDILTDGKFVLVHGFVSLLDFETAVEGIQGVPRILEIASRFQKESLKKQLKSGDISPVEHQEALRKIQETNISTKDVGDIADLIRKLYAGMLRIKVYPFPDDPSRYFAGTLLSDHLQRERPNLYATGKASPAASWYALGLVDQTTDTPAQPHPPQASTLEDTIEYLLDIFGELGKVTIATSWPTVTFTPLAVYRAV